MIYSKWPAMRSTREVWETFQNDTFPDSKERTGITFSQLADIDKKALTLLFVPSGLFIENP